MSASDDLIDSLRQALAAAPENLSLRVHLGGILLRQGGASEAEKEFRTAERKDDNNPEIVFSLGYALLKQHQPDEALKRYNKVYKDDPRSTRAARPGRTGRTTARR